MPGYRPICIHNMLYANYRLQVYCIAGLRLVLHVHCFVKTYIIRFYQTKRQASSNTQSEDNFKYGILKNT